MSAATRLRRVRDEIARAAESVGRDPAAVTLVAVTKGRTAEDVLSLYEAGARDFGESRLQEAAPKIAALPSEARWHFIGALQTNKARAIGGAFNLVHTVAKLEHVKALGSGPSLREVLVQINIAEEPQKAGIVAESLPTIMKDALQYDRVRILGLMAIGAANRSDAERRTEFRRLRALAVRHDLSILSMGMSADFAAAIQEGATHVRVGSALFDVSPSPRPSGIG